MLFALNQGEVCTCQSRLLVQEDIYDAFMKRVVARTEAIKTGDPLDPATMMGAQVSLAQHAKVEEYINIGTAEGAVVLTGGASNDVVEGGYYIKPTILAGTNDMRIFQEEIFGPVTAVTTFRTEEEAIAIANDTVYGLGAGVWTRDMHQAYQVPRAIQAGRVWVNCCEWPPVELGHGPSANKSADPVPARLVRCPVRPRLPGARALRRVQAVWLRARDSQDDAQQLPPGARCGMTPRLALHPS